MTRRPRRYWNAGHERHELDLGSKSLQRDDFYLLEYLLRFNYPVQRLSLARCFLTDADALGLVEALRSNFVLTALDLSRTKITDATGNLLAASLAENETIKDLDLRLNDLTKAAAGRLAKACRGAPTLETLNGLPVRGYLARPPDAVELSGLELRVPEVIMLRDVLREAKHVLTKVDVSQNLLDADAVAVVAEMASFHVNLKWLDLSKNKAGPDGVEHISKMLATNRSLVELNVAENDATAGGERRGVSALLDVLRKNTTLTALDVRGNGIDEGREKELQAKVTVNRALTHTPNSFVSFLDARYAPDAFEYFRGADIP